MKENNNPTFTIDQIMTVQEGGEIHNFARITLTIPRQHGESIRHGTFKIGEVVTIPVYEEK